MSTLDTILSHGTSNMLIKESSVWMNPARLESPVKPKKRNQKSKIMSPDSSSPPMRKRTKHKTSQDTQDTQDDQFLSNISPLKDCHYYEHRTVNSAADIISEPEVDEPSVIPRKRVRKSKPEYVDSEVDIFNTKEKPRQRYLSIKPAFESSEQLLNSQKLNSITESMQAGKGKKKKTVSPMFSGLSKESSKALRPPSIESQNVAEKYPILKNQELVKQFLHVSITNNQKGRIRQVVKEMVRGTSPKYLPEVLNNRIQAILKSSSNLTDADLRKIRVLYNMLKTATEKQMKEEPVGIDDDDDDEKLKDKVTVVKIKKKDKCVGLEENKVVKKEALKKVKGPKRYVVFVGNLPVNITKEEILAHFADLRDYIKDVRIPPAKEQKKEKKSSIAYVEFNSEPSYEMALSKHHSMLSNKRINVLYTAQKNSKISKAEAKGKAAKLVAMGKTGQLIGSVAQTKKRSHRRNKLRQARKLAEMAENAKITR